MAAAAPALPWLDAAVELLARLAATQGAAMEEASRKCAETRPYREHARRLARAIIQPSEADNQQEV